MTAGARCPQVGQRWRRSAASEVVEVEALDGDEVRVARPDGRALIAPLDWFLEHYRRVA